MAGFEPPRLDEIEIDDAGWAYGAKVEHYPSVRRSELATDYPTAIVWHYTAIAGRGYERGLAKRIRTYRRGKDRPASWHFLIGEDGTIYQSVSCLHGSWHCSRGRIDGERVNACSIGIELANAGRVKPRDGRHHLPFGSKAAIHRDIAVRRFRGRYYADFPLAQINAAMLLSEALVSHYGISRKRAQYGHVYFDPKRRSDPGELWLFEHMPAVAAFAYGEKDVLP
jgi:N-acetyl-anhydromuramyl-L-alanine amidase AmpD